VRRNAQRRQQRSPEIEVTEIAPGVFDVALPFPVWMTLEEREEYLAECMALVQRDHPDWRAQFHRCSITP
jgi:hypothetical protein